MKDNVLLFETEVFNDKFERIAKAIESESTSRDILLPEGPPIYLDPHPNMSVQQWNHPAFVNGWLITNALTARIPIAQRLHSFLIDEGGITDEEELVEKIRDFRFNAHVLHQTPLFDSNKYPGMKITRLKKSDLTDIRAKCDTADAQFQMEKISQAVEEQGHIQKRPLMLVVHPTEYRQQQRGMLKKLIDNWHKAPCRKGMQNPIRSIQDMYRYVFLNSFGEISEYSKPVFNSRSQTFQFERLRI